MVVEMEEGSAGKYSSLNRHLTVVEEFEYPNDPRSYVVGGSFAPGRVSHGRLVLGEGSDKERFKSPFMMSDDMSQSTRPGGLPGPRPGARPGLGARERAPGGRAFAHGARPGTARTGYMGSSSSGPTTRRRSQKGPVFYGLGRPRRGPWRSDPWLQKLAFGTWNVTSLVGKVPARYSRSLLYT